MTADKVLDWRKVAKEDRATPEQIRDFYRDYVYKPTERANTRIRLIKNPVCHAAVPLDFTLQGNNRAKPPYVLCSQPLGNRWMFCYVHHGKPKKWWAFWRWLKQ